MRWLYAIIGAVWGGLLGILSGYLIFVATGTLMFFLYGPPPLPGYLSWFLPAVGIVGFLVVLTSCVAAGWRIGCVIDNDPQSDKVRARERAMNMFVAAVLVNFLFMGGIGFFAQNELLDNTSDTTKIPPQIQAQLSEFQTLANSLHDITAIDTGTPDSQSRFIHIDVEINGQRSGQYRLETDLIERTHNTRLLSRHKEFTATPGKQKIRITIDRDKIRNAYKDKILFRDPQDTQTHSHQRLDLIGDFQLDVKLIPILSAAEKSSLPTALQQSLNMGQGMMIREKHTSVRIALQFGH